MKIKKFLPLIFVAVILVAGYSLMSKKVSFSSGDEETAKAFAVGFVLNYKDGTYGENADTARIKLKKWEFRKNHYILDVDAKWVGECCNFLSNTKCEVEKNFKLQINENGKVYSQSVDNLNSCAAQHQITLNVTNLLIEGWQLSMDYNAITKRRVFVDEYGYEYYE